jgi:hypothetical protein
LLQRDLTACAQQSVEGGRPHVQLVACVCCGVGAAGHPQGRPPLAGRTWLVPGTRDAAFAWFQNHPPPGLVAGEDEKMTDASPAATWTRFLSLDPTDLQHQPAATTHLTFKPAGDHVVVVAHAEVVWTPARTAIETIPADVTTGTLAYTSALSVSGPQLPSPSSMAATTSSSASR